MVLLRVGKVETKTVVLAEAGKAAFAVRNDVFERPSEEGPNLGKKLLGSFFCDFNDPVPPVTVLNETRKPFLRLESKPLYQLIGFGCVVWERRWGSGSVRALSSSSSRLNAVATIPGPAPAPTRTTKALKLATAPRLIVGADR